MYWLALQVKLLGVNSVLVMFCVLQALLSPFFISHEVHDSCMNHMLPLTAPRWTNGSLGEQIFYFLIIANRWILSRSKDMAAVLCPPTLPSSNRVNIAFFYEERGGYLLPTRWWSIRRRSSLLTSPFSDPSISLLSGLSQQSMRCLFFTCIFIFRHLAAPAEIQRRFHALHAGRGSGFYWLLLMGASVHTHSGLLPWHHIAVCIQTYLYKNVCIASGPIYINFPAKYFTL